MPRAPTPTPPARPPGPKPRYTRAEIVDTAVALIERDGRDALSLRSLAEELRLTPMALYRYFEDKDELLDAVLGAALAPIAKPSQGAEPWDRELANAIRDLHDALHRSRALAELMALRRPGTQLDPVRERLYAITRRVGLADHEADDSLRALTSYALGFTLVEPITTSTPRHATSSASFEHGLSLLMDGIRARVARDRGPSPTRRRPPARSPRR